MNPKLLSFAALFFLVFAVNAQNYGLRLIGKVKIPIDEDASRWERNGFSLTYVDENSGTFVLEVETSMWRVIMDKLGNSMVYNSGERKVYIVTNAISTKVEGGVLYLIQNETHYDDYILDDWNIRLRTFSTNGYSTIKQITRQEDVVLNKISANDKQELSRSSSSKKLFTVSDHNRSGEILRSQTFSGRFLGSGDMANVIRSKYSISYEVKDGYIYIYYITSPNSKYFINASNLSIKSINGNNVVASIETQSTNDLSIQSSQNAADWKTIQTIANPSGKQITIPANKAVEFIRAIE
jgi:hypothetical protein